MKIVGIERPVEGARVVLRQVGADDREIEGERLPLVGRAYGVIDILLADIIEATAGVADMTVQRQRRIRNRQPELAEFVEEMFETMYAAQGIGLAAPQIAVSKQITVIDVSFKERPEDKIVLINPEIIDRQGKQIEEEGCLSLPDIREKVARASWVKVRAQNVKGEFFEVEGEELLSRALQHEIDHLHGILFLDHLSLLKRDLVKRRIKKLQKNGEW